VGEELIEGQAETGGGGCAMAGGAASEEGLRVVTGGPASGGESARGVRRREQIGWRTRPEKMRARGQVVGGEVAGDERAGADVASPSMRLVVPGVGVREPRSGAWEGA